MNSEFILALEEIEREKNIKKEVLLETIENALISAYKKNYETNQDNVFVSIDNETGVVRVFAKKTVVEEVTDPKPKFRLKKRTKSASSMTSAVRLKLRQRRKRSDVLPRRPQSRWLRRKSARLKEKTSTKNFRQRNTRLSRELFSESSAETSTLMQEKRRCFCRFPSRFPLKCTIFTSI